MLIYLLPSHDLIMIEEKAYDDFAPKQINSKLARLNLLYAFCRDLDPPTPIRFLLAFQGPKDPRELLAHIERPTKICNKRGRA